VEAIEDDLLSCAGNVREDGIKIRLPHVYRGAFNAVQLLAGKRGPEGV
jgi:hypothetical protein